MIQIYISDSKDLIFVHDMIGLVIDIQRWKMKLEATLFVGKGEWKLL